jgi:hypothetical protein
LHYATTTATATKCSTAATATDSKNVKLACA